MRRRSWRWLKARILGLLTIPAAYVPTIAGGVIAVHQSRLMNALEPPREESDSGPRPG